MEYIFVTFDPEDVRDVLADGNAIGKTETTLMLPADYYLISLSGDGYSPREWFGEVASTTPTDPLEIAFTPAGAPR